jgi:hypothetical protein
MRSFKDKTLSERLADKAAAKQAQLRKMKERPGPDDPAVLARVAERKAIAEARAERAVAKAAAAEQARIEQLAREAAEAAERVLEAQRAEQAELERIEQEAAVEAEKKRARDLRYAARKAAKKR